MILKRLKLLLLFFKLGKTDQRTNGFFGFYRGMTSPILSATPVNAFAFSVYGRNTLNVYSKGPTLRLYVFQKLNKFLTFYGATNLVRNLLELIR